MTRCTCRTLDGTSILAIDPDCPIDGWDDDTDQTTDPEGPAMLPNHPDPQPEPMTMRQRVALGFIASIAVIAVAQMPDGGNPTLPDPTTSTTTRQVELIVPAMTDTTVGTTTTEIGEPLVIEGGPAHAEGHTAPITESPEDAVACDTFTSPARIDCFDGNGTLVASYPVDIHPTTSYESCQEDEILVVGEHFGYSEYVRTPDGSLAGVGESLTEYVCAHPDNL